MDADAPSLASARARSGRTRPGTRVGRGRASLSGAPAQQSRDQRPVVIPPLPGSGGSKPDVGVPPAVAVTARLLDTLDALTHRALGLPDS